MRFGGEKILRKAMNRSGSIIVKEYQYEPTGKIYCRLHYDFQDTNNIFDKTFEELCEIYNAKEGE